MPNTYSQNSNHAGLVALTDTNTTKPNINRLVVAATTFILATAFLSVCGQRGDLYPTAEAPSNTNFLLYKGNKDSSKSAEEAQAERAIEQQKVEEAALQDPQDY